MKNLRITIWISIITLLAIATLVTLTVRKRIPEPIVMQTHLQPTIGSPDAKAHIVVFLDPGCSFCARYNNEIYPVIKEKYIDTEEALYTVIPVSVIPNSMPTATALLCTYHQSDVAPNTELFLLFLDYLYKHRPERESDWTSIEYLISMAKNASPAIRPIQLRNCITAETYEQEIVANTEYERTILFPATVPAMFIDGIHVDHVTIKRINQIMQHVLHKHEERS